MIHTLSTNIGSELTPLQNVMVQINYFVNHGELALSYLLEKGFTFTSVLDTRILQFGEDLVDYLETHDGIDKSDLSALYREMVTYMRERQNASSIGGR